MRNQENAIRADIDSLRRRLRGMNPRDPDYQELKEFIDKQVEIKKNQLKSLVERAEASGCDRLSIPPSEAPWNF